MADKPKQADAAATEDIFDAVGFSGLKQSRGTIREEFLTELRGPRGMKIYREMSDNDTTCGALLYLLDVLIQQVEWTVQPAPIEDEDVAKKAADFVEYERSHMESAWSDVISDANSAFTYGWSFLEIVYRRRDDGWIGWRSMETRAQDSLSEWVFDDHGKVDGWWQKVDGQPKTYIPIEKGLHFRTKNARGNPEGRSLLRNPYRPWYFLKHVQEIEGIGIERDLAGFPVMQVPKKIMMSGASAAEVSLRDALQTLVSRVKRDELEGMVIPNEADGFKFGLLSSSGKRQFDTSAVIRRYQGDILMSALAEVLMLGIDKHGSFSLASSKTNLLALSIEAYLQRMRDVLNGALRRLMDLNPRFPREAWPTFEFADVETPDVGELADAVTKLVGAGIVEPDIGIEKRMRVMLGLPPPVEVDEEDASATARAQLFRYHVESGIITLNEARAQLGLPPVAGGDSRTSLDRTTEAPFGKPAPARPAEE